MESDTEINDSSLSRVYVGVRACECELSQVHEHSLQVVQIDRRWSGSYDILAVSVNANARVMENAVANEGSPPSIVPAVSTALLGLRFSRLPRSRVRRDIRGRIMFPPRARNGRTTKYRSTQFFLSYSLFSFFLFFFRICDQCEMFYTIARGRIPLLICKKH